MWKSKQSSLYQSLVFVVLIMGLLIDMQRAACPPLRFIIIFILLSLEGCSHCLAQLNTPHLPKGSDLG